MSPGWADLHAHVWYGGTEFSGSPDRAGLKTGVTALADAGSAGEATLHDVRKYVVERRPDTIRAFINIGSIGLVQSGILMDVVHGAASYDSEVVAESIADGLVSLSISTDLHARNVDGPVFDLATMVSKLHAAGLVFEECVSAISINPRRVLGLSGADGLTPGKRADFTLFALLDCQKQVSDSRGKSFVLRKVFEPRFAILGNRGN